MWEAGVYLEATGVTDSQDPVCMTAWVELRHVSLSQTW